MSPDVAIPRDAGATLLRLERGLLTAGIGVVTFLCWSYLLGSTAHVNSGLAPLDDLAVAVPIWAVMMTGMMLPSAVPMIVTHATVSRRESPGHLSRTLLFSLAYVALWILFSTAGAMAQAGLRAAGVLSHLGASNVPALSAALLLTAGAYQLSPLKEACLSRCRTPIGFFLTEWRSGVRGAAVMGLRHGAECILCCWALMALMFVLGTMNLLWMAALTLLMLAEKTFPGGRWIGLAAGWGFLAWGGWMLFGLT